MQTLALNSIVADKNQPRKFFDAEKLSALRMSISREGIITPLIVQEVDGKFLLIDGERRFRAAQELGLKEVPVVVETPRNPAERLVRQFQIQEMHEGWTPLERANALIKLSEELGITLRETCSLLSLPKSVADLYVAFAGLAAREEYFKSETPLAYSRDIGAATNRLRKIYETVLNKEFTRNDEKHFQLRLIKGVKDGVFTRHSQFTKLLDGFTKNPEYIARFMNEENITPEHVFTEAGAQGAYALRNLVISARYVRRYADYFLKNPDVEISPAQLIEMKEAKDILGKVISLTE